MKTITAEEANDILRIDLFPEVGFPEGFREKLAGKSLEEQMELFRITTSDALANTAYEEITEQILADTACRLEEISAFEGLVVHDGLIVGVLLRGFGDVLQACPPYGGVYTIVGYHEDGTRAKENDECAYLICV